MSATRERPGSRPRSALGPLIAAAHPAPALAVTVLAGLLATTAELSNLQRLLVVAAVGTGQLSIGWSNDLIDLERDRQVGRSDKPLATGELSAALVVACCVAALVATVGFSFATGLLSGATSLVVVVAGWAYNAGLKSTMWSWAPYALAFGALPAFVLLTEDANRAPAAWALSAGALLGVGAHFVNVLPDLDDDAATGVKGLPHRVGARWTPAVAVGVLLLGSIIIAAGAPGLSRTMWIPGLVVVGCLALLALRGRGQWPFYAAVGIALTDVAMLVAA